MQSCVMRASGTAPDVTIVGDLMLDRYWHGSATKLNPEAPGVVIQVDSTSVRLGGAGAVAYIAKSIGLNVNLFGMVGVDRDGDQCIELLDEVCSAGFTVCRTNSQTTVKHRMTCNGQLLHNRFDFEEVNEATSSELSKLNVTTFGKVVLICDYGKGVCTPDVLENIYERVPADADNIVIADPAKGRALSFYVGCNLIKLNAAEAYTVTGKSPSDAANQICGQMFGCSCVVTDGSDGMYYRSEDTHFHVPARQVMVVDPTSAGDTVMAAIAYGFTNGLDMRHTLEIAAELAAQQVSKVGVSKVDVNGVRSL